MENQPIPGLQSKPGRRGGGRYDGLRVEGRGAKYDWGGRSKGGPYDCGVSYFFIRKEVETLRPQNINECRIRKKVGKEKLS